MKFYCIYKKEDTSVRFLKKAAEERGLKFIGLDPTTYDFTRAIPFSRSDLLYRVKTGSDCASFEKFLINKKVTTFYRTYSRAISTPCNILIYEKENISRPKTIYRLTCDKKLMVKYAKNLGFPLIIKATGGSHGVGIIKVDSLSSLFSITDYLLSKNAADSFVMKEFINTKTSARLIILGNKVIDSIEYIAPEGDFRSNEGSRPTVHIKKFSKTIEKMAIRATQALNIEFAGVDILIDKNGKGYVAEANFPCFFPRAQMLTGKNIAGMMLDYLIKKAKKTS